MTILLHLKKRSFFFFPLQENNDNYIHTLDDGRGKVALYTMLKDQKTQLFLMPVSAIDPKIKANLIVGATKDNIRSSVFQWKKEKVNINPQSPVTIASDPRNMSSHSCS